MTLSGETKHERRRRVPLNPGREFAPIKAQVARSVDGAMARCEQCGYDKSFEVTLGGRTASGVMSPLAVEITDGRARLVAPFGNGPV